MRIIIAIIISLVIAAPLAAQDLGVAPPGKTWRKLAAPHFTVLYSEGQDSAAQRAANVAEAVHARLVPFLKWRPDGTTNLIITDNSDLANALSSPLPHRTIALNLSQPLGEFGNYQDWLYEVLVHEYTHILQTDMVDGLPAVIRSVFGRLYVPNFIQPVHQIEGLAVFTETECTGFGRDRSAYYNGVLRAFVKEGKWLPLDRATVFTPGWPTDAPYLFGGMFLMYLSAKYGNERVALYQRRHSRLVWPFLHNWVARGVFGKDFSVLWQNWHDSCTMQYVREIDSVASLGYDRVAMLTDNGSDKSNLAAAPDGNALAWIETNSHEFPSLKMFDRRTGTVSTLDQGYCAGSLSFSPDGRRIAYAKTEYRRYWELYDDLFIVDIATSKVQRLTRGRRAHDPAWSPDGRSLLFVADSLGMNALATMDIETRAVRYLTPFDDSRYSHPSYSPAGAQVALSVWCPGGYQDIYLYQPGTGSFKPLLVDRAQDLAPAWSADGRTVVFASDRSGIWNIFAYDLDSLKLLQVTNAVGGACCPAPLGGRDTVCFLGLSAAGFDVALISGNASALRPAAAYSDTDRVEIDTIPRIAYTSAPYHPWASLKPYFWFPSGFADEKGGALGIFCLGSDALTQLNYQLTVGYNGANGRPAYSVTLTDTRCPLTLAVACSDMAAAHDVLIGDHDTTYWERQQTQEVGISYAWRSAKRSLTPALSYRHQRLGGLNDVLPGGNPFWTGHLASLKLDCSYSDAHTYGFSISPEHGRTLHLEAESFRKQLGSQIEQAIAWTSWTEYLPVPFRHHVLALDGRIGVWQSRGSHHFDDVPEFDLHGFDSGILHQKYRATATVEYRFPLLWIERGYRTWPVYWKNLHGAVFSQAGWQGRTATETRHGPAIQTIGAELSSDWLLSYAITAHVTAGFAGMLRQPSRRAIYWSAGLEL